MIAEVSTDFPWQYVGWLIVGLAAVAVCFNQIDDFIERRKTKIPPPQEPANRELEIKQENLTSRVKALEDTIVEKEWFTKIERDIETMRLESNEARADKSKEDSIHRSSIYRAIDKVRVENSEHIESVRKELSSDIKEMPMQLVALLKNTNSI